MNLESATFERQRQRHLDLMHNTLRTLGNVIHDLTREQATSWRDTGDGWTVTEVLCHLRDYDVIFLNRAKRMVNEEHPALANSDHEALVIEKQYNAQDFREVYATLHETRQQSIEFFKGLSEDQFLRSGIHPERGYFTVLDSLVQIGTHDVIHIEQITRIIAEKCTEDFYA